MISGSILNPYSGHDLSAKIEFQELVIPGMPSKVYNGMGEIQNMDLTRI